MRILFDISHPAHVHFFKHMIWELEKRGHPTAIVAREKDVTHQLLDHYGFDYTSAGRSGHRTMFGQFAELVQRDWAIYRVARRFKPDVILTRNPCGVQVARLVGALGVFDTDDGPIVGIHWTAGAPFAHIITTPDCLPDLGRKQVKYPGYKQLAYLHPNHYVPNPEVLDLLGVQDGEPYFIVRFVALTASHDTHEQGLDEATKAEILRRLEARGRVFLSCEGPVPDRWAPLNIPIPPHWFHDALAFARLSIGDSQTVAAEAAVLGTPSIHCASFAGRARYLVELHHRYGLTYSVPPEKSEEALARLDELLAMPDPKAEFRESRQRMLDEKCDVATWMCDRLVSWVHGDGPPRRAARGPRDKRSAAAEACP